MPDINITGFEMILWFNRLASAVSCYSPGVEHPYSSNLRHAKLSKDESDITPSESIG